MIHVLPPSVYNQIAAGEVVERPASIVKELVENSIDAGATAIVIELVRGGKESIRVGDNGYGILRQDCLAAFLPHATSKLTTAADLERIATMGFRGEALSSIAAVSRVELVTKPAGQVTGQKVVIEGGAAKEEETGCPDGTYLTVKDLFYNLPARLKFLDSDRQEESAVTDCVARLILSNPQISFRYSCDGKKVYQSYGQGTRDALRCVYGSDSLQQTVEIDVSQNGLRLSGFLGRESFSKPNRTYQTLIINGRVVNNQKVANAVYYAYADRLMKRQYPFFVLYLTLPPNEVDVNVHPNKKEVRLSDAERITRFVHLNVSVALTEGYAIPNSHKEFPQSVTSFLSTAPKAALESAATSAPLVRTYASAGAENPTQQVRFVPKNTERVQVAETLEFRSPSETFCRMDEILREEQNAAKQVAMDASPPEPPAKPVRPIHASEALSMTLPAAHKNIGIAFDTYLILELDDCLYFVDQHAAHERILFDKISVEAERAGFAVQDLLLPYIFRVNPVEDTYLSQNLEAIAAIGISIEPFGDCCYKISAVPAVLCGMDLAGFTTSILQDLSVTFSKKSGKDFIKQRLMSEACRAAVKGGDKLEREELVALVGRLGAGDITPLCPHGRPFAIKVTKTEVEKWFKRIVN